MSDKIVLFDVMDTLVRDPFHEELPRAFGVDKDGFLKNKQDGLWPRFERRQIDETTFVRHCLNHGTAPDPATVREHLWAGYQWLDGMEPLLDELCSCGVEIHAFSNYPVWYRLIEEKLSLSRYLSWSFVSWETGLRKPTQQSYSNVAESLNRSFNELVFVDNAAENCRIAQLLGINTHVYSSSGRLRAFLRANGLV